MILTSKEKKVSLDSLDRPKKRIASLDLPLARFIQKNKNTSILFSRYGRTKKFTTSDSKLYFTQEELKKTRHGEEVFRLPKRMDGLSSRNFTFAFPDASEISYSIKSRDVLYENIKERYSDLGNYVQDFWNNSVRGVSMIKMWNLSIVGSLIFGMFLMTMIYRYLGQGAAADSEKPSTVKNSQVLGADTSGSEDDSAKFEEMIADQILIQHDEMLRQEAEKNNQFQKKITQMVKGYPIEKMVPYIAKKDKIVAAFIVGIAKKESDWGKHVPVLDGEDCYNYWGYRGKRDRMGTGGHTCFNSPQDAVDTVAKRIEDLVYKEKIKTPQDMVVVWKCGYDCSWDSQAAVKKWITDVDGYFSKVDGFKKD